jgi:hypothetical protein
MNYPSICIEGAILSPDILDRLEDALDQRPADFGMDSTARVKDEITSHKATDGRGQFHHRLVREYVG